MCQNIKAAEKLYKKEQKIYRALKNKCQNTKMTEKKWEE